MDGIITHMKMQIENPTLLNSRFRFDEVLFLDANFHRLNLTRGSSYLPLPDWIAQKKAIINPQNDDKECFKWSVIAASKWVDIKFHPECVSNVKRFENNYNWSGLEFPAAINKIGVFKRKNDVSVTVLALKGPEVYIARKPKCKASKNVNLVLITDGEHRHYMVIKSLSRLLGSKNSKHTNKQYFCLNCLQGFHSEQSRDKH